MSESGPKRGIDQQVSREHEEGWHATPRMLGAGGSSAGEEGLAEWSSWCLEPHAAGDKGCSPDLGGRGGSRGGGKWKWLHLKGWHVSFPTSRRCVFLPEETGAQATPHSSDETLYCEAETAPASDKGKPTRESSETDLEIEGESGLSEGWGDRPGFPSWPWLCPRRGAWRVSRVGTSAC